MNSTKKCNGAMNSSENKKQITSNFSILILVEK